MHIWRHGAQSVLVVRHLCCYWLELLTCSNLVLWADSHWLFPRCRLDCLGSTEQVFVACKPIERRLSALRKVVKGHLIWWWLVKSSATSGIRRVAPTVISAPIVSLLIRHVSRLCKHFGKDISRSDIRLESRWNASRSTFSEGVSTCLGVETAHCSIAS